MILPLPSLTVKLLRVAAEAERPEANFDGAEQEENDQGKWNVILGS